MATHATIGVEENDGSVTFVYRHSDGYPDNTGRVLQAYFPTPAEARALIRKGQVDADATLRSLDETQPYTEQNAAQTERLRRAAPKPHRAETVDEYRLLAAARHAHFAYLMTDEEWRAALPSGTNEAPTMGEFTPISDHLETATTAG